MYVKVGLRESSNVHFHFTCEISLIVPVSIFTEDKMSFLFKTKRYLTEEWTLLVGFICSSCHSQCLCLLNEDFVFTWMNVELCLVYEWVKQEIPLPPLVPGSVKSLTSDLYLPVAWWHVVLSPSAYTQISTQVIVLNRFDNFEISIYHFNFSSIEIYDMASKKSTELILSMFWQTPTKLWHLKQQWKGPRTLGTASVLQVESHSHMADSVSHHFLTNCSLSAWAEKR